MSILFHWSMAALFFAQFWLGWTMQGVADVVTKFRLYHWHKSLGFTILALAVLRILWALTSVRPALPAAVPAGEKQLALGSHILLYLALIILPLTGWAVVSTSPLPIPTWVFGWFVMPSLPLGISLQAQQAWSSLHGFLAYAAVFLAGVHGLAALRHHFKARDGVLLRMLRPGPAGQGQGAADDAG